jgi:hypothetical protein
MKSRYFYLAASAAFLVSAVLAFWRSHNVTAAVLDAIAGAIFFFLGAGPQKRAWTPTLPVLDLDEDFLAVQQHHRCKTDQNEGNGIEQWAGRKKLYIPKSPTPLPGSVSAASKECRAGNLATMRGSVIWFVLAVAWWADSVLAFFHHNLVQAGLTGFFACCFFAAGLYFRKRERRVTRR